MKKILFLFLFSLSYLGFAQGSPDYGGGLKVSINEDGSKYFRIISWAQMQATYSDDVPETSSKLNFNLRRARILMYSQINKNFLILAHFGLNSLNANNMSAVGKTDASQLFFHDIWAQYSVGKKHAVGGGLHYWNGISRLNNQSTLNIMTLDNNRQSWSTLGLTDQFARHMGVYAKGSFDKLQYRVSINDALTNGLDSRDPSTALNTTIYGGRKIVGSRDAGKVYSGYFEYGFKDAESNFLPFKVGSYLGTKKIFNVGAGFFMHPKGSVSFDGTTITSHDVNIFAVDAFYDAPVGTNGSAITAYATYQSNDYGKNYLFSAYGTGSMMYAHLGYVLARDKTKTRFQPYLSYASNSYDAVNDDRKVLGVGTNAYMSGHNSKLTLEYKNEKFGSSDIGTFTLQAMIYL
ncbi:hypothetical protein [uncultured Flavobacterium sp.]|uniref:hypothetical protein n=1 Tax=uncultured Flavobacterium sp. TaxID=165435 RepID=UPI0030CA373D|tara:strand:- start:931 stop:2145 length:1215 start_codon:yes stop_codon:yes gene_type:complete